MKLKDFAAREGISVQRAAKLAREGRVTAVKSGKSWDIDPEATLERRARRPLSAHSKDDFFEYCRTGTFDHVKGTRKARLIERVREWRSTPEPAKLLRDWWSDEVPEGPGGAALVRSALSGIDVQVFDAQRTEVAWVLDNPTMIAGRVSDYRHLRGWSIQELAQRSNLPVEVVRRLEREGISETGNLHAATIVSRLQIPAVLVNAAPSRVAS